MCVPLVVLPQEWEENVRLGADHLQQRKYQSARTYFQKALDQIEVEQGKENNAYVQVSFNVAISFFHDLKPNEANRVCLEIIELINQFSTPEDPMLGEVYYMLTNIRFLAQDYEKAKTYGSQLLENFAINQGATRLAVAQGLVGEVHYALGNYRTTIDLLSAALNGLKSTYANASASQRYEGLFQMNQKAAKAAQKMRSFAQSEKFYIAAIELVEKAHGRKNKVYLQVMLDFARMNYAGKYYQNALTILNLQKEEAQSFLEFSDPYFTELYNEYQRTLSAQGDYKLAAGYQDEAFQVLEERYGDMFHPDLWPEIVALIDNLFANEHYKITVYRCDQALGFPGRSKQEYRELELKLAISNYHLKDFDAAEPQLLKIKKSGDLKSVYKSAYFLAKIYELQKNNKAMAMYNDGISASIKHLRSTFFNLSETDKKKHLRSYTPLWNGYKRFALEQAELGNKVDLSLLYHLQTASKGLILRSMAGMKHVVQEAKDQSLVDKYASLETSKVVLSNLALSVILSKDPPILARFNASQRRADSLEREFSRLIDLKAQLPVNSQLAALKKRLKENEVAVEIIRIETTTGTQYAALAVQPKEEPRLMRLGDGKFLEGRGYKNYLNSIVLKVPDAASYSAFWGKLDKLLGDIGVSNVYLAPDGIYHLINPVTLQKPDGTMVADAYKLHVLNSSMELLQEPSPKRSIERAVLFGRPTYGLNTSGKPQFSDLIGTEQEVKAIDGLLNDADVSVTTYLGPDAAKNRLTDLRQTNILHLATHGYFLKPQAPQQVEGDKDLSGLDKSGSIGWNNSEMVFNQNDEMLRSGLILAGAEDYLQADALTKMRSKDNGFLTAMEASILGLDQCELVVLSACQSGVGDLVSSEGVYGIKRAFQLAGAKRVVISLWKVADRATAEFMKLFYAELLRQNFRYADAFSAAQQQLRSRYPEPYYWGAFVLVGPD